jgi:4-hydroxybenzoate polyprenyltransferase
VTGRSRGGLAVTLEMIKFQHTIFALPFALTGMVLAARGLPTARSLFWVVLAMIGARSAAMAFNRIVDRIYDARNPRTADRPLPAGKLSVGFARWFTLGSVILFVISAGMLNRLCLWLSPLALAVILGYSYTKRFTAAAHLVLGLALGIAPVGGYLAVSGHFSVEPLLLLAAVLTWTAGFDVLYALQDVEFDRTQGLHSIPVRLGPARALRVASALHLLTVIALASLMPVAGLGWIYGSGVVVIAGLLIYEHAIISPDDLSRLGVAFFRVNAAVSILVFAFTLADLLIQTSSVL